MGDRIHTRTKALLIAGLLCALLLCMLWGAGAGTLSTQQTQVPATPPFTGTLTTDTWGVFDPKTGALVAGENVHAVRPIASVTKLFTAAVVLQSEQRDTAFTILAADLAAEGRAGRLAAGERMTPYHLLFPLILESSNDAAGAIARMLGGDFERLRALAIADARLADTILVDGSGLSEQNVSTVTDLARFFAYLKYTAPHLLDISQLRQYLTETAAYQNNDPARAFAAFTGGKHGFTDASGETFVGSFRTEEGREVGVVLLGSTDLTADIGTLLPYLDAVSASGILAP